MVTRGGSQWFVVSQPSRRFDSQGDAWFSLPFAAGVCDTPLRTACMVSHRVALRAYAIRPYAWPALFQHRIQGRRRGHR